MTEIKPIPIEPEPVSVRCGDCLHFVRDGKCRWHDTDEWKRADAPFSYAPFWVWSDCYSDKEQVRADVTSRCPTFKLKAGAQANG